MTANHARPTGSRRPARFGLTLVLTIACAGASALGASGEDPLAGTTANLSSAQSRATATGQKPTSPPAPAAPAASGGDQRPGDSKAPPVKQPSTKPAAGKPSAPLFHFAGFAEGGYQWFAAADTFDATLGETSGTLVGGGAVLTHRSGTFFQVDVTRFKGEGERVFVYGSEVFPLGIPLSVEVTPIEFTGGYKFFVRPPKPKAPAAPPPPPKPFFQPARPRPGERTGVATRPVSSQPPPRTPAPKPRWGGVKPYVGGGIGIVKYKETSEFAGAGDNVDDSFTSYHALGGLEIPLWKWLGAAVEANYRWVPDALGKGGASQEFGEEDLGGPSVRFKLTIGR